MLLKLTVQVVVLMRLQSPGKVITGHACKAMFNHSLLFAS